MDKTLGLQFRFFFTHLLQAPVGSLLHGSLSSPLWKVDEHDLSIRKLNDYQIQLRNLQKVKSERLDKVLEHVNEVHSLCGVLGVDFHTLENLVQSIQKLKVEKQVRTKKLQETVKKLIELWNLTDSSEEERSHFE